MSFADKVVFVTGAGQGMGRAVVQHFGAAGAQVVAVDINLEAASAAVSEFGANGLALACNVSDPAAVKAAFAAVEERFGRLDVVVNSAGIGSVDAFLDTPDDNWTRVIGVNLTGTFLCIQAALPDMLAARQGRIVNIASTAGQRGYAYVAAYVAAKHGVVGLTRALALELAPQGITVNAVCPGYTETEILRESIANVMAKTGRSEADARAEFARGNPQGRIVQPQEVADAVQWLCSDAAGAITGQSISVSGGEVM